MDDLRLLRHFETVYRLTSFSAAADELGLTHSAVTKSIKQLEENWQVQLFHRTTRTVAPTEAGKRLYPRAIDLLAHAEDVRRSAASGAERLNIVCGPGVLENMIAGAAIAFAKRFPDTRIDVASMPPHLAVEELIQRRIHLLLYHEATLSGVPHRNRLRQRRVAEEPYWMVYRAGHPVAADVDRLEDAVRLDWAIAGLDDLFEQSLPADVRQLFQENGVPHYRLLSQTACLDMARESDVVTILPESGAKRLIEGGEFAGHVHPGKFHFRIGAAVLYDAGQEPTVEHFINCL